MSHAGGPEAGDGASPQDLGEMACRELVERVTEYLDGALEAVDHARFEQHMARCPGCAEILEQFRAVVAMTGSLRSADAAAIDAPARQRLLVAFRGWKAERP